MEKDRSHFEKYGITSQERGEQDKETARLLLEGAEYDDDGKLIARPEQKDFAHKEMENNLLARDLRKNFNTKEIEIIYQALQEKLKNLQTELNNRRGTSVSQPTRSQEEGLKKLSEVTTKIADALPEMEDMERKESKE